NDKVFVKPSILKSKIDIENNTLDFDFFFTANEELFYFSLNQNGEIESFNENIDFRHSGGRMQKYLENKFIYAVPDYNQLNKVENQNSIYGKILSIDDKNNYKIISYGHRNPQGLLYDLEKDIILSTEHGPSGGDEINLIKKGKGYGWPYISKGKDPQVISKDHAGNNYEEPIYFWKTNPGISQIIKIPTNEKINKINRAFNSGSYLVASLHGSEEWAGRSLWNFKINKNNKVEGMQQFIVNDRIRDLVYDEINEKLILVLENQIALAIIDTIKKNLLHNTF
ncbi:PQQ-dependent sugar dehydrogenase, partial [Candidatus Pelagibacter sp.]|nr:PQQ-dependent sugar dehydrogenase [Candidatus Pelagibacter sp.]